MSKHTLSMVVLLDKKPKTFNKQSLAFMNIKQIYSLELEKKKGYNENLELISKSKYMKYKIWIHIQSQIVLWCATAAQVRWHL